MHSMFADMSKGNQSIRFSEHPAAHQKVLTEKDESSWCFVDISAEAGSGSSICETDATNENNGREPSHLPPPKPYFDRSNRSLPKVANLVRTRSSSPQRPEQLFKKFLELRGMMESAPQICSSRAAHNRIIGCEVLKFENCKFRGALLYRNEEFEQLLDEL